MVTRGKATDIQLAYLAGIVDGEGCITFHIAKPGTQGIVNQRITAELTVVNSNRLLIDLLSETFGGKVYHRPIQRPHHKPTWSWKVTNTMARDVCAELVPFLLLKKRQAEIVISFHDDRLSWKRGKGAICSPEEVDRRVVLVEEMKQVNDSRRPQRLIERALSQQTG